MCSSLPRASLNPPDLLKQLCLGFGPLACPGCGGRGVGTCLSVPLPAPCQPSLSHGTAGCHRPPGFVSLAFPASVYCFLLPVCCTPPCLPALLPHPCRAPGSPDPPLLLSLPQWPSCVPPASRSTTSSTRPTPAPPASSPCWPKPSTPCRRSACPATRSTRWATAPPPCWVSGPAARTAPGSRGGCPGGLWVA